MSNTSEPNEWDRLVAKIGQLTLTMGVLEMAVMAMHCKATGQSEAELKSRHNWAQRKGLRDAAKARAWPEDKQADLAKRLSEIEALDIRRNSFIHIAAGVVSDNSIHGVPVGSVIDLRTYGLGVTNSDGKSWTFGVVGKKVDMAEIDKLIDDIQQARLGLIPYMELVDEIAQPQISAAELVDKLKNGKMLL